MSARTRVCKIVLVSGLGPAFGCADKRGVVFHLRVPYATTDRRTHLYDLFTVYELDAIDVVNAHVDQVAASGLLILQHPRTMVFQVPLGIAHDATIIR